MKGSLILVSFFVAGTLIGALGNLPNLLLENNFTIYALYALVIFVGISIGADKQIKQIIKTLRPKLLLIPLATIVGTLSFSALASLFIAKWNLFDCLAVGSGFAYYSLSSILITELKAPTIGIILATELATLALMTNIIREIITLLAAPVLVKIFGPIAPISAGGATTIDTTLPVITKFSGKQWVFVAILHGIIIDLSVPILVSLFCTL